MTKKHSLYRRAVEVWASSKPFTWIILNVASRFDPLLLRVTRGRFSASNLFGFSALMLTTLGAKTGLPHSAALVFSRDGDRLVIVASRGGMDRHPGWYHNLKAHPKAEVLLDGCSRSYIAYEATSEEYKRLWALSCENYSGYAAYQKRAGNRQIPIMFLIPQNDNLDAQIEKLESQLCTLALKWRSTIENRQEIKEKYHSTVMLLFSLGWDGYVDLECELPDKDMPQDYFRRNQKH